MLAAVTAAAGLYWLVAAEAWAMQLHGALFLAFGVAAAVFIWRWRDPAKGAWRMSRQAAACHCRGRQR